MEATRLIQGGSYVMGLTNALGSLIIGPVALVLGLAVGTAI